MARLRTNLGFGAASVAAVLISVYILFAYLSAAPSESVLRIGYLPNVTHAQALYGISTGYYQAHMPGITLDPRSFNAGPTAIGALLANQVDLVFVGPSPTLNGLAQAGPDVLRVIAGGASGGALFVIQPGLSLATSAAYTGKKFATPQLGNTQDIALKHFLLTQGHKTLDQLNGDVDVINAANPDILTLFQRQQIDGAWVPEPWATRLVREANGKVFLDERSLWPPDGQFMSTQLVTTTHYLDTHRPLIQKFLEAQVNLTLYLQNVVRNITSAGPGNATCPALGNDTCLALQTINDAIKNATSSRLANETLVGSFFNFNVTYVPIKTSLAIYLKWAGELGFGFSGVSTSGLYDLSLLNAVLTAKGLPPVT